MSKRLRVFVGVLGLSLALSACQTMAGSQAASVDLSDAEVRADITSVLAQAVGRARIELGPTDNGETSVITVLPPPLGPLETNATAMPIRFNIVLRNGRCFAVRHDTKVAYALPGITCKPAAR